MGFMQTLLNFLAAAHFLCTHSWIGSFKYTTYIHTGYNNPLDWAVEFNYALGCIVCRQQC